MKPRNYQQDKGIEAARDVIEERKAQLVRRAILLTERKKALSQELAALDEQLDAMAIKIGALQGLLEEDFPAPNPRRSPSGWQSLPLPEAAEALLQEAGGFLTASQIAHGLRAHGRESGNTTVVRGMLDGIVNSGQGPLLRVADDLWGSASWAEQARASRMDIYLRRENE